MGIEFKMGIIEPIGRNGQEVKTQVDTSDPTFWHLIFKESGRPCILYSLQSIHGYDLLAQWRTGMSVVRGTIPSEHDLLASFQVNMTY